MVKNTRRTQRGETSLSRERIIEGAIALLDSKGESGLTLRALSQQLATGAGAIYWHVAGRDDLLVAACDAVVVQALNGAGLGATPQQGVRAIGLGLYDALDAHPWMGAALIRAPGTMPMVRILEGIGGQVRVLGVPERDLWRATNALLNYILGVAGQNAANSRIAREQAMVRSTFLDAVASAWFGLDEAAFPFTRSMAGHLRAHDDRDDFLAGIDLILAGIAARA